jgi:hypothetical protein
LLLVATLHTAAGSLRIGAIKWRLWRGSASSPEYSALIRRPILLVSGALRRGGGRASRLRAQSDSSENRTHSLCPGRGWKPCVIFSCHGVPALSDWGFCFPSLACEPRIPAAFIKKPRRFCAQRRNQRPTEKVFPWVFRAMRPTSIRYRDTWPCSCFELNQHPRKVQHPIHLRTCSKV